MNEFDVILEECVDLIASGESSLEECLSQYPEYAAQLEPVLITVSCLREEGRDMLPSLSLRSRIRAELDRAMKDNPQKKSQSPVFFGASAFERIRSGICLTDGQSGFCPASPAQGDRVQLEADQ